MERRRMTLGPLDSQMNASQLPSVPGTAQKMQRSRMSLGPRASMGPPQRRQMDSSQQQQQQSHNGMNMLTKDLNSMTIQNNNGMAMSGRPSMGAAAGRQSMSRRSSAYGGRPSSIGYAATSNALVKDPRNVRDKQWQFTAIRLLIRFLSEAGYEKTISAKILGAPSAKDFQHIFKFLYTRLDPYHKWQDKKFEDEVPVLLKGLNKSQLYAVGSMHTWPSMLAMLVWMVDMILCLDQIRAMEDEDESLQNDPHQIFYNFSCRSYQYFLSGADSFEDLETELAMSFRKKDEWSAKEITRLKEEVDGFKRDLNQFNDTPSPLETNKTQKQAYLEDIHKVKKWTDTLVAKQTQLLEQIDKLKVEVKEKDRELEHAQKEKNGLQEIVDGQEISPADIDRMNAEREQLSRNIEQLTTREDQVKNLIWESEIACQKKLDQVEKLIKEFNDRAFRLDLIPASAKYADGLNFEASLSSHAMKADQMVSIDLRGPIKSALLSLCARFKNDAAKKEDEMIAVKEVSDRNTEVITEKSDEVNTIESKIRLLQEHYEAEKQTSAAEIKSKTDEIESIERELRRFKVEGTRGLFDSQKSVRELTIEYDNLLRRTGEQKEKLVKETLKALEELVEFKTRIATQMQEAEKRMTAQLHEQKQVNGEESSMNRTAEVEMEPSQGRKNESDTLTDTILI